MKVYLLFFILVFIFSCDLTMLVDYDLYDTPVYDIKIDKLENRDYDNYTESENVDFIVDYVESNIEYKHDIVENWKTPFETNNDGFGDCEDISTLIIYLINQYTGLELNIYILTLKTNHLKKHCESKYKNKRLFKNIDYEYVIYNDTKYKYSYSEALKTAEYIR